MLSAILTWYLVLQGLSLAGLPLAWVWLRHLPSRGYAAAKALGLLLTGVLFWWGCILHLWANTAAAALMAATLLFGLGLWLLRGRWGEVAGWWREHWRFVVVVEAFFLLALIAWALVRAAQPQLETAGGEKWMEIAFLNAVLRAPAMPPHDPWLSGYAISYYYLGYLLLGIVTRLSGLPATVAFNLGNAGWYALAAVGAYGILYDLLAPRVGKLRDVVRPLLAPLLLLITGNAEGLLESLHSRGWLPPVFWAWLDIRNLNTPPQAPFSWIPQRFFWWWQASRTLRDYTPWGDPQEVIDEFPAFSFILGDMHPHVLALPFALLIVALALNLYRRGAVAHAPWDWKALLPRLTPLLPYALVLGTLGFLNTWDLPIYWALLFGALVLGRIPDPGDESEATGTSLSRETWPPLFERAWRLAPEGGCLGVLSILLYFPFWYALRSQAGGILPNLFNATRLPHFAVMFAPLLVPLLGVLVGAARRARLSLWAVVGWGAAFLGGIATAGLIMGAAAAYPYLMSILRRETVQGYSLSPEQTTAAVLSRLANPWVGLLLALGASVCVLAFMRRMESAADDAPADPLDLFPLLLAFLGIGLTLAPEFLYLKDIFMTRMNTVFKFYFQAWVLWSLVGAWQVARWTTPDDAEDAASLCRYGLAGLSGLLILVGLVYTFLAIPARAQEHGVPWTLDGTAWLDERYPQDAAAIRWLNAHVAGASVIVETPADAHRAYVYEGRVAALTGLPTVLGWSGHQLQWRGNYDEPQQREADLEQLFTTLNPEVAREILARYAVEYIYIGPVETSRYPAEGLQKFATLFPAVYAADGVAIYHVKP